MPNYKIFSAHTFNRLLKSTCFISLTGLWLGCAAYNPPLIHNGKNHMNIPLTPSESDALQQDKILIDSVAMLNKANHSENIALEDIFADAVPIPEMLYWVNENELSRAKLKELLNNGVDINQGYEYFGKQGYTALHVAAEQGYLNTAKFLIENGANPSLKLLTPSADTPIELAQKNHQLAVVKYLEPLMKK